MIIIVGFICFILGACVGCVLMSIMASAGRDSFERDLLKREADKENKE